MDEQLAQLGLGIDLGLHMRVIALVLARMLGLCVPLPFLGGNLVPPRVRFAIPFLFTLVVYPYLMQAIDPRDVPDVGFVFVGHVAKELFIGYCMGFVIALPFHALSVAGSYMDTQRGTMFAQVADPLSGGQTSPLGQFYNLLFITIFLSMGGMQIFFAALTESYAAFPVLAAPPIAHPTAPAAEELIRHSARLFTIAVQFAAPVVVTMFLTDVTLGIVNRAAPNVQVFFLGMPIKALGALVIVFVTMGFAHAFFAQLAAGMLYEVRRVLVYLGAS